MSVMRGGRQQCPKADPAAVPSASDAAAFGGIAREGSCPLPAREFPWWERPMDPASSFGRLPWLRPSRQTRAVLALLSILVPGCSDGNTAQFPQTSPACGDSGALADGECIPKASGGASGAGGATLDAAAGSSGAREAGEGGAVGGGGKDAGTGGAGGSSGGCTTEAECSDGIACTVDTCKVGTCDHSADTTLCPAGQECGTTGCEPTAACSTTLECQTLWANDPCKSNILCEPATSTCAFSVLDNDHDGHAAQQCGGDDCNDNAPGVHPGASEACDGIDQDCNLALDDDANCGPLQQCMSGACKCKPENLCAGSTTCVDLLSDSTNCGTCGNACPTGATCLAGNCECPGDQVPCGATCVNTGNDASNCGTCGKACATNESCETGACVCNQVLVSVTPQHAGRNRPTSFTITGQCLPSTAAVSIDGCSPGTLLYESSAKLSYSCTPTGDLGIRHGTVSATPGGKTIGSFDVVVDWGASRQSCDAGDSCGSSNESCCSRLLVTGGSYKRGRGTAVNDTDACPSGYTCPSFETPEHAASVSSYWLDSYEVTVGRFRQFVERYDGVPPPEGSGANPKIPGSGWQSAWNPHLPQTRAELEIDSWCSPNGSAWKASNPEFPMNCVSWHIAFAFCIWDGGRLATENEWEYAAAAGQEDRLFPWGQESPSSSLAVTSCQAPLACTTADMKAVGSVPLGVGKWGHHDLAGSVSEWVFDSAGADSIYASGQVCDDCAAMSPSVSRAHRGGAIGNSATKLRAASRLTSDALQRVVQIGFRCAADEQ